MVNSRQRLRIAFVAGTLGKGGAEKQLIYMVQALCRIGVDVRVYELTTGEFYEHVLQDWGIQTEYVGRFSSPFVRLLDLTIALARFRPHIIQSVHFFTNLYAAVSAPICKAIAIGSIRNDLLTELDGNRFWGRWLLHVPPVLVTNSHAGSKNATALGIRPKKVLVLRNVIDLPGFDAATTSGACQASPPSHATAIAVGRLVHDKRFDRFLTAVALARRVVPGLKGILVGDGPEAQNLKAQTRALGLGPESMLFLGRREDVPNLLKQADMLVISSDHEGFPNVLLEAMAARLPVITTPAGDAGEVVQEGTTGFVVPFNDTEAMVDRMVRLAVSHNLRRQLGEAGRHRVAQHFGFQSLTEQLLSLYGSIAQQQGNRALVGLVEAATCVQ